MPTTREPAMENTGYVFVLTPNGSHYFSVHLAGCRDLRKVDPETSVWTIEAPSARDAVTIQVAEFEQQEMGYQAEHFKILPCCKGAK